MADLLYGVLSSGSVGNSYVFSDGDATIMVDAGLTMKQTLLRLQNMGLRPNDISAVFLTHLHPDHAKCAKKLATDYDIPIFIHSYAAKREAAALVKYNIPFDHQRFFELENTLRVGSSFRIEPFELYHDSEGTVGYKITALYSEKVITIITDTGSVSEAARIAIDDSDLLFLEANYDDYMLEHGPYPKFLQRRIASENGHLSNKEAADLLDNARYNMERLVYLIHRSDNNNSYECIKEAFGTVRDEVYSSIIPLDRGEFIMGSL